RGRRTSVAARVGGARGEVGAVVVGVGRAVGPLVGRRVAQPRGGRRLEVVGRAVADEVPDAGRGRAGGAAAQRGGVGDEGDLAGAGGHGDATGRVGSRQGRRATGAGALLHQVVAVRRDAAVQRRHLPAGARGRRVLDAPA